MRIQSIGQYYSKPLNNINGVARANKNVRFGSDSDKYDAAYRFFEQISKVEALEQKLEKLKSGGALLIPFGELLWIRSLNKTQKALEEEKSRLDYYRGCYQSYNPRSDEFIHDVDEGRKLEMERRKKFSSDETYSSYAEYNDLMNEVSTYP